MRSAGVVIRSSPAAARQWSPSYSLTTHCQQAAMRRQTAQGTCLSDHSLSCLMDAQQMPPVGSLVCRKTRVSYSRSRNRHLRAKRHRAVPGGVTSILGTRPQVLAASRFDFRDRSSANRASHGRHPAPSRCPAARPHPAQRMCQPQIHPILDRFADVRYPRKGLQFR